MNECPSCKLTDDPERHARVHEFIDAIEQSLHDVGAKTYSADGRALSTMPDVSTLTYIGQAYVPTINFDSDVKFQQAIPGTPSDRFAATYRGRFEVRTAGSYTFCTTSDDGSDLTIDGSLVVDNGGLHASRRRSPWRSGSACAWDRDAGVDHEVSHGKAPADPRYGAEQGVQCDC